MADGSVTIAATIHSPSSHCYSLFDRVLILVGGGVVYSGPTGEGASGIVPPCHDMNVLGVQVGKELAEGCRKPS